MSRLELVCVWVGWMMAFYDIFFSVSFLWRRFSFFLFFHAERLGRSCGFFFCFGGVFRLGAVFRRRCLGGVGFSVSLCLSLLNRWAYMQAQGREKLIDGGRHQHCDFGSGMAFSWFLFWNETSIPFFAGI